MNPISGRMWSNSVAYGIAPAKVKMKAAKGTIRSVLAVNGILSFGDIVEVARWEENAIIEVNERLLRDFNVFGGINGKVPQH